MIESNVKPVADPLHLSGRAMVTGQAKYIGDDIKPENMYCVKCVFSKFAHANIVNIDTEEAAKLDGVVAILTAKDVPGANQIGHVLQDEPLLPDSEVMYVGQPVALVVAINAKIANAARKLIKVEYSELPAILTIDDALKVNSLYVPPCTIESGDVSEGFRNSAHTIEGEINTQTQEHVYFETQRCWANPGDDGNLTLYSATQTTSEVQEIAARVLGLSSKDVTVDVRRLGGGFGGKERSATLWGCLAALAAYKCKKPVELKLTRAEDVAFTGKRHPFQAKYKVGFDNAGKILAYDVTLSCNGGAFVDLSLAILQRAMFHADNAYFIPNAKICGKACKTHLPPNTAFRGFGGPQGIFTIESIIEKIAYKLNVDAQRIRELNLYKQNDVTPYGQTIPESYFQELFSLLHKKAGYSDLLISTHQFNQTHRYVKRGVGVIPVKFGISFTFTPLNQGTALIWIYADGSISMSHGGIEMGQEINTKVAQVVARELGVTLARIRMESSNTQRNGNASPTAASSGSDINGNAALHAAQQLKERLAKVAIEMLNERNKTKYSHVSVQLQCNADNLIFADDVIFDARFPDVKISFVELVKIAHLQRVNLGAQGFYKTPNIYFDSTKMQGSPFFYYVYGIALVQSEIDVLTGDNKLTKVRIFHECNTPINITVDLGQITGAFMQGYGYCTMEDMSFDASGKYLATDLSTYKIPTIADMPQDFTIELITKNSQHASVMGSKAVGEPPLIYGLATFFAIKNAILSINPNEEVELAFPATGEAILNAIKKINTSEK